MYNILHTKSMAIPGLRSAALGTKWPNQTVGGKRRRVISSLISHVSDNAAVLSVQADPFAGAKGEENDVTKVGWAIRPCIGECWFNAICWP